MDFLEGFSVAALLAWMACAPLGLAVGADRSAVEGVLLFGGIAAVVHVWLMATRALAHASEAVSRRRFRVALALGTALGLYFPATQGWLTARFAAEGLSFCISHTRFYPWGCLGYVLYGFAALLAGRAVWRRWRRVAVPPAAAVAAAWAALAALQFLYAGIAELGAGSRAVCGWLPFSLAGLDAHAPYHAALAAGLVAVLGF